MVEHVVVGSVGAVQIDYSWTVLVVLVLAQQLDYLQGIFLVVEVASHHQRVEASPGFRAVDVGIVCQEAFDDVKVPV